jgi:hypothetical protein
MTVYERRHRINELELGPVVEAIETQLEEWYHSRNPLNNLKAEQLFRLWYRIRIHCSGRPDYPEFSWKEVENYLGFNKQVEGGY